MFIDASEVSAKRRGTASDGFRGVYKVRNFDKSDERRYRPCASVETANNPQYSDSPRPARLIYGVLRPEPHAGN